MHSTLNEPSDRAATPEHSILTDVANMLKAFMGLNFMAVAYAFSNSGMIRGIVGLVVIALITEHCCSLLVEIKDSMYHRLPVLSANDEDNDARPPNSAADNDEPGDAHGDSPPDLASQNTSRTANSAPTYGDIAMHAGGPLAERIINLALVVTQFGFCVGYLIFLSQTAHDIVRSTAPVQLFVLLPLPVIGALSLLSSIRSLGPFSHVANAALLIGFVAVVSYIGRHFAWAPAAVPLSSFPLFFGQMTGALEGIGLILPVQSSMHDKSKFPLVLRTALVTLTAILMVVGILGFATFGAATRSIILLNFDQSPLVTAVKAVLVVGILFTYPLQIIPVIEYVERRLVPAGALPAATVRRSASDDIGTMSVVDESVFQHNDGSETETEGAIHYGEDAVEMNGEADGLGEDVSLHHRRDVRLAAAKRSSRASPLSADDNTVSLDARSCMSPVQGDNSSSSGMFVCDAPRVAIRLCIVTLTGVVAVLAGASFGVFTALVGSLGASVLAYTAPAVLHSMTFRGQLSRAVRAKNLAIALFGSVGGICGTIASIWEIILIHRGEAQPA